MTSSTGPRRPGRSVGPPHTPPRRDAPATAAALSDTAAAEAGERSVLDVVIAIKSGALDPAFLAPADRQRCVAHLGAEALTVPEIAQFLRCSDRTVTRDRRALQEAAALSHDPALAGRFAGQLLTEAMVCIDRIRRVGRDRSTPPAVRVDAERSCFEILSTLTQRLQSLGFLPAAAQRLEAAVAHHHVQEVPTLEAITAELRQLKGLTQDYAELPPEVLEAEDLLLRAELATRTAALAAASAPGAAGRGGSP